MSPTAQIIYALLMSYFITLNLSTLGFIVIGIGENRTRRRQAQYTDFARLEHSHATVALSIIVPAYNEEAIIRDTVLSILGSRHPQFEVLVVNDGSTDDTLDVLRESFDLELRDVFYPQPIETEPVRQIYRSRSHPNLWVIDKDNGGEADACNAGVNIAYHPYVLHTDADCIFEPDTLIKVVRAINFDPRRTIAIGGQLRPANGLIVRDGRIVESRLPNSLVARFQVVEYMSAFLSHRLAWSRLNAAPVIAGGFGVWRRDVVVDLGGYATDVTHEDIELTIHAHRHFRANKVPYRIVTVPDATVWTQGPTTWRDITRQRKRWQRIVLETLWKYRTMLFNPRYGSVGMLTMPYLLIYEGLGPFVEVFAYLFVIVLACVGLLDAQSCVLFLAFSIGLSAVIRLAGVILDVAFFDTYGRRDVVRLALLAILEPVVYRPVLLIPRMLAMREFLIGHKRHETLTRTTMSEGTTLTLRRGRSQM